MGNIENISPVGAEFKFGGKKLKMVFINKAVKYLKEKYGGFMKAIAALDDENGEIDYQVLGDVLYAGFMVNKDESITIDWIAGVLDNMTMAETKIISTTHLIAAITGTYPEAKEGDNTPQK